MKQCAENPAAATTPKRIKRQCTQRMAEPSTCLFLLFCAANYEVYQVRRGSER
jgi:hypothetical protein